MESLQNTSSSRISTSSSTVYGRRKLKEEAEIELFQQPTLAAALEHLWNTKPAYVYNDGGDLWIDEKDVDAKIAEIVLRFKVNSFPDRAERLTYLQSVLKQKWANKPDIYKSMMMFLIEMSNQPIKNLDLKISDRIYSTAVENENDSIELILHGKKLREDELKKEEFRRKVVEDLLETRVVLTYSSDEELSDWGTSSDEENQSKDNIPTSTPVLISTPEISSHITNKPSEAEEKEIVTKFWKDQREKGAFYFRTNLRHIELTPLTDQPVISSIMALYSRFGEYWEWKKASSLHQRPTKKLVSENDIIRELIWQFTSPSCQESSIFTPEWSFHREIIVRSLSHSSLDSFITRYGQTLSKLHNMKQFITNCSVINTHPIIFRAYAHALSQVLTFITRELGSVERYLRIETNSLTQTAEVRPPSTLVQFNRTVEPIIDLISSLAFLHSQTICLSEGVPNWLKALKLISCLEIHLNSDTHPQMYGLVLYIFSKCLLSVLDLILKPLESMEWKNNDFLFCKSSIGITDPNFWNEIITTQPISEEFKNMNLQPLSCLQWILPKILTTLKLQEIMNQLNPAIRYSSPISVAPSLPSYKVVVTKFLERLLERRLQEDSKQAQNSTKLLSKWRQDYELHLHFLGLKDSIISEAFRSLVDDSEDKLQDELGLNQTSELESSFFELEHFCINTVPITQISHSLGRVIEETFEPCFRFGDALLRDIFQCYALREAVPLLQEIIFGGKEEFALACIQLAYDTRMDELRNGHPTHNEEPNTKFQNLLNFFYPEGRSTFEIEFIFESKSATNFDLKIQPLFPLTLLLTPITIAHYICVAMAIFKIRKGIWLLNRLNLKECRPGVGMEKNRVLLVKFSVLQFLSSLRSFVLSNTFNTRQGFNCSIDKTSDINEILKGYESQSSGPLYRILRFKLVDAIIIKPMLHSSMILSKNWKTGISLIELTKLSTRVKAAWEMILEFGGVNYPPEMNQMAQFFGPVPSIY